jgi:hypothetical protein
MCSRGVTMGIIRTTLALLLLQAALAATPCDDVVCVEVHKSKDAVTFFATSRADGVSISFSVSAVNMEPSSPPMLTRALSRGRTELMTLKVVHGKKPIYEHAYLWVWGVVGATHDDRVSYRLPFESGKTYRLVQGPDGALSHKGQFALDFSLSSGTAVCAARAGVVVEVVDSFGDGGNDRNLGEMANKILILHDDGTVGAYLHLLRGGMRVKPGDRVEAGAVIGLSGNSGWSTGPHLHFEVFRTLDMTRRQTVPIKFRIAHESAVTLEEGKSYRAE